MKYLSEYRDPELVQEYLGKLQELTTRPWTLMEICGGQTHSLVKNGLLNMLPDKITMVHGPGCPVCVTSLGVIDEAIWLAHQPNTILCSFGDMLRVPGSKESLLEAKAAGADVRILYSPLEAVQLAVANPDKEVVFFAVGFETTAPANALSVVHAHKSGVKNYSILASHVLVPPAMEALLSDPENKIDGFLAAGHVCTIMGMEEYYPIAEKYRTPIVITGFEPVDLLQGILMTVIQLEQGEFKVENQYSRYVQREGNRMAQATMQEVFTISDRAWRGIGNIPASGYEVNDQYRNYNARLKFNLHLPAVAENENCISGEIMRGLKKPFQCPNFGTACKPEHPLGAPMVSSEGACAAYYHYSSNLAAPLP
ncbi:hydrogenase formation protein HypD [Flavihumibacter stibioxidans]|uniref:Hydrogenase formation protein HypD n=1 Tax=Flavihumibacter stibioxidans TaxID=1834163 RepID=A0ABR7M739_9BACT|nr:hydrogenase formation protein HypD [Flavihumibacter stibioxidans]MBC6490827.1 hydrogenase formation protein HypD [Flavihumibacter stibioxidans]